MKPLRLAGLVLVVLILVGGGLWARASAPCSWYGLSSVKDVPARCLMHR